jgi:hypothetical protein
MIVGSRFSPGLAVGSNAGTEEPRDLEGTDELREDFFIDDGLGPTSAESFMGFRTRFFRGCAEECEMSTSAETSTGPISPD